MTRPTALTVNVTGIPEALRVERRWVLWRYTLRDGRWTKLPFHPSGAMAKANDATTWTTFDAALAAYRTGHFDGIGFALGDGWAGLDFDDCVAGDAFVDAAQRFIARLVPERCYRELSPSGTGVKMIGRSARMGGEIKFASDPPERATWTGARFFTVTGHGGGDPTAKIKPIIDGWFPAAAPPADVSSTRDGYTGSAEMSDDDLLCQMIGGDTNGDAILALWRGETDAYGGDHSRADLAFCCYLAWWTNYDADRIDRMFRQSGLMRPKWDRATYRRATLKKALAAGRAPDATLPGPDVKVKATDLDVDWMGNF